MLLATQILISFLASTTPTEFDALEVSVLDGKARLTLPLTIDEEDAWNAAVESGAGFPERLDAIRPESIVLPGKTAELGTFVGYEADGGASEMWWVAVFDAKGVKDASGVAVLGGAADPKLRPLKKLKLKSDEGISTLESVRSVLDEKLSAGDRRRLGKKVLSDKRVSLVEGDFPNAGALLVTVSVPMRGKETFISTMFTLTATGELATMLSKPSQRLDAYATKAVGDLDGDGFDDIIFESSYYEGAFTHLTTWSDGEPQMHTIAGDGA